VLRGVLLGEWRQTVALRTVDLRGANAGLDDGLLPTVVREVALLRSLGRAQHPGIVRLIGAEVVGEQVHVVTEYTASSFLQWFSRPRSPQPRLRAEIRERIGQLLQAVAFLHGRGIFHRNITPPNVLIALPAGTVKLCDFACGRVLDSPLRPYSPEDPKLRPQSSREARRLWYRAPELLLRQPAYGPAVDIWGVGVLMAEAARGEALFPSESEIDHLFRIFRFAGTPGRDHWPQAVAYPTFSPRFPVYEPVDLQLAARAARSAEAEAKLKLAVGGKRADVLNSALRCGAILGSTGADLLGWMLRLDPQQRCTADSALSFAFLTRQHFMSRRTRTLPSSAASMSSVDGAMCDDGLWDARTLQQHCVAKEEQCSACSPSQSENVEVGTPRTCVARAVARIQLDSPPPRPISVSDAPNDESAPKQGEASFCTLWRAMTRLELDLRTDAHSAKQMSSCSMTIPSLAVAEASLESRAAVVDSVVGLAGEVHVGDFGLHLGVALFDEERLHSLGRESIEPELAAAACLKLADAFDEHSQEYYQRERANSYYHAAKHRWPVAALLEAEKQIVQRIGFHVHRPTVAWFLRACIHAGGHELVNTPGVVRLARFIADISLLDAELQKYSPALRAQVTLLIALHASTSPERALHLWLPVRHATCSGNSRELASLCLARTAYVLHTKREQWGSRGLQAVERRHPLAARQSRLPRELPAGLAEALLPGPRRR